MEVWDDECSKCNFYTVRWDDSDINETDKFFTLYDESPQYQTATQELLSFILNTIGDDHGALDMFFNRHENEVKGLPSKGKIKIHEFRYHFPGFPLRLYALKIRDNIVVLFNGGIKDSDTNQTSSLNLKWREACSFARRIDQALFEQEIKIEEETGRLLWHDGSEEIIL
ncbi:MAG: hypothetical protein R3B93_18575 [Bacteroidia bacterium]